MKCGIFDDNPIQSVSVDGSPLCSTSVLRSSLSWICRSERAIHALHSVYNKIIRLNSMPIETGGLCCFVVTSQHR